MKQVIDNLNDFVTYMAVNYSTMGFEEVVIFDEENDGQGRKLCVSADVIPLQREVEPQ